VRLVPEIEGFEIILGRHHYHFVQTETPFNRSCSAQIANNKYCTNRLLAQAGLPVPEAFMLNQEDFNTPAYQDLLTHLIFPVVLKPLCSSSKGQDVLCNIQTIAELHQHVTRYLAQYPSVIIERFHAHLTSYRVLMFRGNIIGVVERIPAMIVGDGIHSIKELIALTNQQRHATLDILGDIKLDEECLIRLRELGISADFIPANQQAIRLCYTSNATRGGTYQSLSPRICQHNKRVLIIATQVLNLEYTGIDVQCQDINEPFKAGRDVIIEVNHRPSIRIHEHPIKGKPVAVTRKIMWALIAQHPWAYINSIYQSWRAKWLIKGLSIILLLQYSHYLVRFLPPKWLSLL
tara:strand:- start:1157 stop:2203 length:1047 start_codon:yes stop_codon:yes gene_type:complete